MKFIVESDSIAVHKMSGIGHATLEIIRELQRQVTPQDKIILVVPFGKKKQLDIYKFPSVTVRSLPPGYKYINFLLVRTSFPFPVDSIYGKGFYISPNYKNWYVPRSTSLTFVHDVAYKIYPDTIEPRNLIYLNKNMTRWLKRSTYIAAISKSSSKEIVKYFPKFENKIVNIPLGVDPSMYYKRSEDEISAQKKALGIQGEYFLFVSNIEPRKNVDKLLDAYIDYCDNQEDSASLLIVGGGGWKNEVTLDRIKSLKNRGYKIVRPSKYVEDESLPALYSGARALIQISLHEGFGLSVAQAQACGTPLIISNIPVLREISEPTNRVLVSPTDSSQIANAMRSSHSTDIITNPSMRFTWYMTVKKILKIADILRDIHGS